MFDETKHKDFFKWIKLPGFKPSDYFLFKQIRDHFVLDTRRTFVLGLRVIYAAWHDPVMREMVLTLATQVQHEEMDKQVENVVYKEFKNIVF